MKSTCQTPASRAGDPRQILAFALGVTQILAFLDTNMLVYPMQNCGVGGLSQREDQTRMVLHRSGI